MRISFSVLRVGRWFRLGMIERVAPYRARTHVRCPRRYRSTIPRARRSACPGIRRPGKSIATTIPRSSSIDWLRPSRSVIQVDSYEPGCSARARHGSGSSLTSPPERRDATAPPGSRLPPHAPEGAMRIGIRIGTRDYRERVERVSILPPLPGFARCRRSRVGEREGRPCWTETDGRTRTDDWTRPARCVESQLPVWRRFRAQAGDRCPGDRCRSPRRTGGHPWRASLRARGVAADREPLGSSRAVRSAAVLRHCLHHRPPRPSSR